MRKFINCDVLSVLNEIMRHHTQNYQEDFDIDKEILLEAAEEPRSAQKRYLWMCRRHGTHCLKESEVYLKGTTEYYTWKYYDKQAKNEILAYAVEISGINEGFINGDIYELDYSKSVEHVCKNAVGIAEVELFLGDEQKVIIPYSKNWYDVASDYHYFQRDFIPTDYAAYACALNSARLERLSERYANWSLDKLQLEYGEKNVDAFCIYQLKPDMQQYLFEPYYILEKHGFVPAVNDYSLIYVDELDEKSLDDIFSLFNVYKPDDFIGHSLSISDVVVTIHDGQRTAYYVDNLEFRKLPNFFTDWDGMQMKKEIEM